MAPKDTTSALLHSLLHLKAALIRVENARRNKIRANKNKGKNGEKAARKETENTPQTAKNKSKKVEKNAKK